jgi:alanine racemase
VRPMLAPVSDLRDVAAEQAGTTVTIDLDALVANWRLLADTSGGAECSAVVKADAYGLGLEGVVAALQRAGCRTFFVAHVFEGQRLRALAPEAVIYVLNGLMPRTAGLYLRFRLRPVLSSLLEMEDWRDAGRGRAPCALQVDSGMNRLGLVSHELSTAKDISARLDVVLVMSHFVWSGRTAEAHRVAAQIAAFDSMRSHWPDVPASLANSSGIFSEHKPHYDLVRPGYAIYGGNPTPDRPNPMRPVVGMEAKVLQVRNIAAGETVGYDGRWTAPAPRRLATISAGYADGIPCAAMGANDAGPRGQAIVDGALCPFVGRISMDMIVIDVTDAPTIERGDSVELLGSDITIDDLAARAGTIGYEVLTRLGVRSHRRTVCRQGLPVTVSASGP